MPVQRRLQYCPLRQALAETTHLHLHTAQELLGDDVALDEPWMYLRAIGGVDED